MLHEPSSGGGDREHGSPQELSRTMETVGEAPLKQPAGVVDSGVSPDVVVLGYPSGSAATLPNPRSYRPHPIQTAGLLTSRTFTSLQVDQAIADLERNAAAKVRAREHVEEQQRAWAPNPGPSRQSAEFERPQQTEAEAHALLRAVNAHNGHDSQNVRIPPTFSNSTAASLGTSRSSQNITLGEYSWLQDVLRRTVPIAEEVRVERRYAMLSASVAYNRRSTRGKGVRLQGGEVALISSLDEFCYVEAMEPGFAFTELNKAHLYRRVMSEARNKGYWVLTRSGMVEFPAGNGSMYLADLARRASEGVLFRGQIEQENRERAMESYFEDWRSHLIRSRNVVDIGVFDRWRLRLRWKLHSTFGMALALPPRQ